MPLGEFDIIHRYFRDLGASRDDVLVGVGDDGAVTRVPAAYDLVSTVDALVEGVHFEQGADAADIGHKALAVNLSDLAAMGAEPAWATLVIALPAPDEAWLEAFAEGFGGLATKHGVRLVGGDTVAGPLQLSVQCQGLVPAGAAVKRSGAQAGDAVFVTGTLGDAALALELLGAGRTPSGELLGRLRRPTPRVALGAALPGLASSCIDVSDGLGADLGHILSASGVGARLQLKSLPGSVAVVVLGDEEQRWRLQLGGGDDYELCFTAAEDAAQRIDELGRELDLRITRIGTIESEQGLLLERPDGSLWEMPEPGYEHFRS